MPLTPAEKQKRYRERIKNDPQKYETQKKKDLDRIKKNLKTKKIGEMTESERIAQRKIWRERKKTEKERKKRHEEIDQVNKARKIKKQKSCYNQIVKKYNAALEQIRKLKKINDAARKRYRRLNDNLSKNNKDLENRILKLKAREEMLEAALKIKYKNSNITEKRVFKDMARQEPVKRNKAVGFVTKLLGLRGTIRREKLKRYKVLIIKQEIKSFFLRDDITRCTAGKKECRTQKKDKQQKRYLLDTLSNLFAIYKEEGGKYSFSTFYKYKPFFVLSPSVTDRDTCLCVKHSNMDMLFNALKQKKIIQHQNMTELISSLVCDRKSRECMYGECDQCNLQEIIYNPESETSDDLVTWQRWERVNHEYQKTENGKSNVMITKKTEKKTKEGSVKELKKEFETHLALYKKHSFNVFHQQKQYQDLIKNLGQDEAAILCDFSENYAGKMGEEIQAMHFGASKSQITLHCGMVYWANDCQSFCTISDSNGHDPAAIWAHLMPIIKMIQEKSTINTLHFYSDGPSSQYRQKKNFFLLTLFQRKLHLEFATWSFFESGHGKGVADGIGGAVKRCLDRQVSYGKDVTDANEAHGILSRCMKSVYCVNVTAGDVENLTKVIPTLQPVAGTLKIHQVISKNLASTTNEIYYRSFSCFCVKKKLCDCFSPKKHTFPACQTDAQTEITVTVETHQPPSRRKTNAKMFDTDMITTSVNRQDNYPDVEVHEIMAIDDIDQPPSQRDTNTKLLDADNVVIVPAQDNHFDRELHENIIIDDTRQSSSQRNTNTELIDADNLIIVPAQDKHYDKVLQEIIVIDEGQLNSAPQTQHLDKVKVEYIICDDDTMFKMRDINQNKPNKSLRKVVSRNFQCNKCSALIHFTINMAKCMSCQKRYCTNCCDGQFSFDYICETCFEDGPPE